MRKFIAVGFLFYISALLISITAQISSIPTQASITNAYQTVQDEGTPLTQRNTINFTGAGVTCTDDAGNSTTDCDIPGSGGSSGTFQNQITNLKLTASGSTLTFSPGICWGATKSGTLTATISSGTGSGSYVAYCTSSQALVVLVPISAALTLSCTNVTCNEVTSPSIPEGAYAIASGNITGGSPSTWATPTDLRDFTTRFTFTNGAGMNASISNSALTLAVDTTLVQMTANNYSPTANFDASGATLTKPMKTGTATPGTCSEGEYFFETDTDTTWVCTAANTWTAIGGGSSVSANGVFLQISGTNYLMPGMYAVTTPSTSGKSYLANAGTAAATTTSTGNALKLTLTTGTSGWRPYGKSLSGTTKLTVALACPGISDGSADIQCGVGFRESGSGKLEMIRVQPNPASNGVYFGIARYNNPTSFSSNPVLTVTDLSTNLIYYQIEVSGGTIYFRYSPDGTNWQLIYSESSGTFLTPDELFVGGVTSTTDSLVLIYSWREE